MKQITKIHLVGNFKMNPETLSVAENLIKEICLVAKKTPSATVWLAVPALYVTSLVKQSKELISIGVQNIHSDISGAHTGDISGIQAVSCGARFTILGHSERRALGETNADINKKVLSALKQKLQIVLCVGETARDTDGTYIATIKQQIQEALLSVDVKQLKYITIAYEPVWAIGAKATGVATPHESLEISILIRRTLQDIYSVVAAKKMLILYGGSANSTNASGFMQEGGVQGFLLGRASLDAAEIKKISEIIK
jgi:triosephosphate isomerase (TIM)